MVSYLIQLKLEMEQNQVQILIYSPCMTTYNLGNKLGNYLNEITCAIAAKISIVIGTEMWDYPDLSLLILSDIIVGRVQLFYNTKFDISFYFSFLGLFTCKSMI
jgi:hypothetical protein